MTTTPWSDEVLLDWIKRRCGGMSSTKIAAIYKAREEYVRVATNRVLEDDIRHCGIGVAEHYWNRVGGRRKWT